MSEANPTAPAPAADPAGRRPLKTRSRAWAQALARRLVAMRASPNGISAASVVCAAAACAALIVWPGVDGAWPQAGLLVAAAAGIQFRLLCNMLDGMVAVEGGLRSATGDLWNEVPDRLADSLIIIGVGYGIADVFHAIEVAWAAALVAMMTAYIRALGASLGLPGCFHGPMAKPHRMALLTAACLATAVATVVAWPHARWLLWAALAIIVVGGVVTCVRRLSAVVAHLKATR